MAEEKLYLASEDWLTALVEALRADGVNVVAPKAARFPGPDATKRDEPELSSVTSAGQVASDYLNTRDPLKRLLLPPTEVLLRFELAPYAPDSGSGLEQHPEPLPTAPTIALGVRPCDAAALDVLDRVFLGDSMAGTSADEPANLQEAGRRYDDSRYRSRREQTTIVAFACTQPGPACFCTSVGGSPAGTAGSDLLVFQRSGDEDLILVLSDKGRALIERLADAVHQAPADTELPAPSEVPVRVSPQKVKGWLDTHFENDFWLQASLRCLGCGACSYVCPTCHCFDIVDEGALGRGERRRNWDCCSFQLFTLHASGHNPRPDRAARWRQRLMHKFKYFPERLGRLACVGCGRCLRVCGAGQNVLNILAEIESLASAEAPGVSPEDPGD